MAETRVVIRTLIQRKLDIASIVQTPLPIRSKIQSKISNMKVSVEGFD